MTKRPTKRTVPAETYVADYYLTTCDGHEEFQRGEGGLPERLALALKHADLRPGQRLLDIACGRGEVVLDAAHHGLEAVGLDYSRDAVMLAAATVQKSPNSAGRVMWADGRALPFKDRRFDRIVLFDVVEHLYPWELHLCLKECRRLLALRGKLIIHTAPNLWYYRFGYPLFRLVSALAGKPQPADPRDRWAYQHEVHVNEQTPIALKRAVRDAGFAGQVWLEPWQRFSEDGPVMRLAKSTLTRTPGLRLIFCNDIFAVLEPA